MLIDGLTLTLTPNPNPNPNPNPSPNPNPNPNPEQVLIDEAEIAAQITAEIAASSHEIAPRSQITPETTETSAGAAGAAGAAGTAGAAGAGGEGGEGGENGPLITPSTGGPKVLAPPPTLVVALTP